MLCDLEFSYRPDHAANRDDSKRHVIHPTRQQHRQSTQEVHSPLSLLLGLSFESQQLSGSSDATASLTYAGCVSGVQQEMGKSPRIIRAAYFNLAMDICRRSRSGERCGRRLRIILRGLLGNRVRSSRSFGLTLLRFRRIRASARGHVHQSGIDGSCGPTHKTGVSVGRQRRTAGFVSQEPSAGSNGASDGFAQR